MNLHPKKDLTLEIDEKYARGRKISKKKQEKSKPGHTIRRETDGKYARGREISKKKASRGIPDDGKLMKSMPEEEKKERKKQAGAYRMA